MATKVFALECTGDREVLLHVGLLYPLNAAKRKWMDEVKVIVFGPSEKLMAYDQEVQARLKELEQAGVEVIACKACADKLNVTEPIEKAGFKVVYVGQIISQLLREGWASLTF